MNNTERRSLENAMMALRYLQFAINGLGPDLYGDEGGIRFMGDMEMLQPASFLIAHAVELSLMAYLSVEGIKAGGGDHDLVPRLQEAEAQGLSVDPQFKQYVQNIDRAHNSYQFRYAKDVFHPFVSPRTAIELVGRQIQQIHDHVAKKVLR